MRRHRMLGAGLAATFLLVAGAAVAADAPEDPRAASANVDLAAATELRLAEADRRMGTGDEPDDLAGPDPDSWRDDDDYRRSRRERGDQPAATTEERATRQGPVGGLGREDGDDAGDRELEYERGYER